MAHCDPASGGKALGHDCRTGAELPIFHSRLRVSAMRDCDHRALGMMQPHRQKGETQSLELGGGRMRLSIMQPYLFPYIGYFHLVDASDVFVFYDDAQYRKNSWVNRNRILVNGAAGWLTLPVRKAHHTLPISARDYHIDQKTIASLLGKIAGAYRKAPHFSEVFPLISELLSFEDANVARFNENCVRGLSSFVGLKTKMLRSGDLPIERELKGEERILAICKHMGATHYLNASGGTSLYRPGRFADCGVQLQFLPPTHLSFPQFGAPPIENLSIIDVMMFNSRIQIRKMLAENGISRAGARTLAVTQEPPLAQLEAASS
jgi:hypothetical protein